MFRSRFCSAASQTCSKAWTLWCHISFSSISQYQWTSNRANSWDNAVIAKYRCRYAAGWLLARVFVIVGRFGLCLWSMAFQRKRCRSGREIGCHATKSFRWGLSAEVQGMPSLSSSNGSRLSKFSWSLGRSSRLPHVSYKVLELSLTFYRPLPLLHGRPYLIPDMATWRWQKIRLCGWTLDPLSKCDVYCEWLIGRFRSRRCLGDAIYWRRARASNGYANFADAFSSPGANLQGNRKRECCIRRGRIAAGSNCTCLYRVNPESGTGSYCQSSQDDTNRSCEFRKWK